MNVFEEQQRRHSPSAMPDFAALSMGPPMTYAWNASAVQYLPAGTQDSRDPEKVLRIGVHDAHVGLLFGRGGAGLMELQTRSQCSIRVSQRGEYVAGKFTPSYPVPLSAIAPSSPLESDSF